jgi:hypothetical protein
MAPTRLAMLVAVISRKLGKVRLELAAATESEIFKPLKLIFACYNTSILMRTPKVQYAKLTQWPTIMKNTDSQKSIT